MQATAVLHGCVRETKRLSEDTLGALPCVLALGSCFVTVRQEASVPWTHDEPQAVAMTHGASRARASLSRISDGRTRSAAARRALASANGGEDRERVETAALQPRVARRRIGSLGEGDLGRTDNWRAVR